MLMYYADRGFAITFWSLKNQPLVTMSSESPTLPATVTPEAHPPPPPPPVEAGSNDSPKGVASKLTATGISTWAKSLKVPQPFASTSSDVVDNNNNTEKSAFAKFTSGLGLRLSPKSPQPDETTEGASASSSAQPGLFGAITKGLVDTSKNAVKAVQVKARHAVSQNKRRYQVQLIFFQLLLCEVASSSEVKSVLFCFELVVCRKEGLIWI